MDHGSLMDRGSSALSDAYNILVPVIVIATVHLGRLSRQISGK